MNRREFVKAVLGAASFAFISTYTKVSAAVQGRSSWALSLLPWDPEPIKGLEFAKSLKPDFVFASSSLLASPGFSAGVWKSSVKKMGFDGTGFWYGAIPYNFSDQSAEIEKLTRFADDAKAAGGKLMLLKSQARDSYGPGPEKVQKLGQSLNQAGAICKARGLKLFFQNDFESYIRTPQELEAILGMLDKKKVQLAFDFAHFAQSGGDYTSILKSHSGKIGLVILKDLQSPFNRNDGRKSYNYRFIEPGVGKLEFSRFFEILKSEGCKPIFLPDPQLPDARNPEQLTLDYLQKLREPLGIKS